MLNLLHLAGLPKLFKPSGPATSECGGLLFPKRNNAYTSKMRRGANIMAQYNRKSAAALSSGTHASSAHLLASLAAASKAPKTATAGKMALATNTLQPHQHHSNPPSTLSKIAPPVKQQPNPSKILPASDNNTAFLTMYASLEEWTARYCTSHVPRHCFDAGSLGAWVWQQRHLHRRGNLEQWKVDRLNLLGFNWAPSKDDAQWHANVHHLRQFRLMHGPFAEPFDDGQHGAWRQLPSWLQAQGLQLAAGQLPMLKEQVLTAVGVTLRVDSQVAERGVRLQGLNGHERRLVRKRWKQQDKHQVAKEQQDGRRHAAGPAHSHAPQAGRAVSSSLSARTSEH